MIARRWEAHATREHAQMYAEHLREHVLPELRRLKGYISALLLEVVNGDDVELTVMTFWQSMDAIQAFSGPDVEEAVVAEEAAAILTRFERRARHFEVVEADGLERLAGRWEVRSQEVKSK